MTAITVEDLKRIKAMSDARRYREKAEALRRMMAENPDQFSVDSDSEGIVGLTHNSTGFRFHLPKAAVVPEHVKAAYWNGFYSGLTRYGN